MDNTCTYCQDVIDSLTVVCLECSYFQLCLTVSIIFNEFLYQNVRNLVKNKVTYIVIQKNKIYVANLVIQ